MNTLFKILNYFIRIECLWFILSAANIAYADSSLSPSLYLGILGGIGNASNSISQRGTSFISNANGGPLTVNATGNTGNYAARIVGIHLGYTWPMQSLNKTAKSWAFAPAAEIESYYLGTIPTAHLTNPTPRIVNHSFIDSFPMNAGVFLVNVILTGKPAHTDTIYPYLGGGIGAANLSIAGANAAQINPAEPGINHFNSNSNASSITFAAQVKAGLAFYFAKNTRIFAEYRLLHLTPSNYTFGSTQYVTHARTANWNVHMGSMNYQLGAIGIDYLF